MDYSKPTLLVVSGPNGAGKSTHIQSMLPADFEGVLPFDRDKVRTEFEGQLSAAGELTANIPARSMRLMEDMLVHEMKQAIHLRNHFVLETPLSHPDYWAYIDLFEKNGYQVQLNYLCLDKISDCIARVSQRIMEGGHYVDPNTIKGVYNKNLEYIHEYQKTFKVIDLYDGMKIPTLLARIEDDRVVSASAIAIKKKWINSGLPSIAKEILALVNGDRKRKQ